MPGLQKLEAVLLVVEEGLVGAVEGQSQRQTGLEVACGEGR